MVLGRSVDAIKTEKADWYMRRFTPRGEPVSITKFRLGREAYVNGFNDGAFLFLAPAVSQAAACDGKMITTSSTGQEAAPGTPPVY